MNDMEAYGDGYMAPEEEWEREGLLDPAWEKQQKKVSKCYHSRDFFFSSFCATLRLAADEFLGPEGLTAPELDRENQSHVYQGTFHSTLFTAVIFIQ